MVKEIEISDLDENLNENYKRFLRTSEAPLPLEVKQKKIFKGLFDDIDVNSNKLGPTVIKKKQKA